MPDDQRPRQELIVSGTVVQLVQIPTIVTFQVMESDLDNLDKFASEESQALGFMTGAGGAFLGFLGALLTASNLSAAKSGALVALTAVLGCATLWFGVTWLRVRKKHPGLVEKIRARAEQRPIAVAPPVP